MISDVVELLLVPDCRRDNPSFKYVSEIRIKVMTHAIGPWPYAMFFKENGRQVKHIGSSCSERRYYYIYSYFAMFLLSHVLGNKLFGVSGVLIKQIMATLVQISFELYEHVVCSPFPSRS